MQIRMLIAKHWTEHRDPNGRVRERTEGAEGTLSGVNGMGGPWSCEGLMLQCRGCQVGESVVGGYGITFIETRRKGFG